MSTPRSRQSARAPGSEWVRWLAPAVLAGLMALGTASASPIAEERIAGIARTWIQQSRLFGVLAARARIPQHSVGRVSRLPLADGAGHCAYVVELLPAGYLVAAGDDRLPPLLALNPSQLFLPSAPLDRLLHAAVGRMEAASRIPSPTNGASATADEVGAHAMPAWPRSALGGSGEPGLRSLAADPAPLIVGPLIRTRWSQAAPFNSDCPPVAAALAGHAGRAPAGCVATALAQLMHHYRWPHHGRGSRSYEDRVGSELLTLRADFTQPLEWGQMRLAYAPFAAEVDDAARAVAALVYRIDVALGADFEAVETAADFDSIGATANQYWFYQSAQLLAPGGPGEASLAIGSELLQGRPILASVPGHTFLIDGYAADSAGTFFHANYGWGGDRDDWYTLDNVHGAVAERFLIGLEPLFLPLLTSAVRFPERSPSVRIAWDFPVCRAASLTGFRVLAGDAVLVELVPPTMRECTIESVPESVREVTVQARDAQGWRGKSPALAIPAAAAPLGPELRITRHGDRLLLSWPVTAPPFGLEHTQQLGSPESWAAWSGEVRSGGDSFIVTNSVPAGVGFYRLRRP